MNRRLYRCRHDRRLAGVAGGVAEFFDLDPTLVRILFFLSIFLGGMGLFLYIGMAIIVPLEPAMRGYRYVDLGGSEPPFYIARIRSDDHCASVTLHAPLEFTSASDAEPGAPAVAQVRVSVGLNTLHWDRLLDVDLCSGVWAELLATALSEVAALDLLERSSCPVCGPIS